MSNKKNNLLNVLQERLKKELEYKEKCDRGEVSVWDNEYECNVIENYHQTSWMETLNQIKTLDFTADEIENELSIFLNENKNLSDFIPTSFVKEVELLGKRKKLEEILKRDDVVEYISSMSKEELEKRFGKEVARMKDFDQKNPHHCYDLLGHTLHTVEGIKREKLTEEQFKELRISAFLHDIGKTEVVKMHPKIKGQQVFYGHAEKSAEISQRLLKQLGYDDDAINRMIFYIGHHDDFISYKSDDQLSPNLANHEFIREISPTTVAEVMVQNEYNYSLKNFNKDQVKYICYALAHGKEPDFQMGGRKVKIDSSMQDALEVAQEQTNYSIHSINYGSSDEYDVVDWKNQHSLEDYQMLINLCRADANAQAEIVKINGKQVTSKQEKIENMNNIENCLPEAKRIFDLVKLSNIFLGNIAKSTPSEEEIDKAVENQTEESLEYFDCYGGNPWHEHSEILNWTTLTDKSANFLSDLRRKIEEQKEITITNKVNEKEFNEIYTEDLKDLNRIIKIKARKEKVEKLEKQLSKEEAEENKIKQAENLVVQLHREKTEEGR